MVGRSQALQEIAQDVRQRAACGALVLKGHATDIGITQSGKMTDDMSVLVAENEPRLLFVRESKFGFDIETLLS